MQRVALAAPPALGEAGRLPRTRHFWGSKASDGWSRRPRWVAQPRVTHPQLCPRTCPLPCHLSLPPTEVVLQAHTSLTGLKAARVILSPWGSKQSPHLSIPLQSHLALGMDIQEEGGHFVPLCAVWLWSSTALPPPGCRYSGSLFPRAVFR